MYHLTSLFFLQCHTDVLSAVQSNHANPDKPSDIPCLIYFEDRTQMPVSQCEWTPRQFWVDQGGNGSNAQTFMAGNVQCP